MLQDPSILIFDERLADAEALARQLRDSGLCFEWSHIGSHESLREAIGTHPDLILCGYGISDPTPSEALQLARESGVDSPFIVVSDMRGEDEAVEAMRWGAEDYVLRNRPDRLADAVRRALAGRSCPPAHRPSADRLVYQLNERLKELTALYAVSELLQHADEDLSVVLDRLLALIPGAFQFPSLMEVSIYVDALRRRTRRFSRTEWTLRRECRSAIGARVVIEVAFRTRPPVDDRHPAAPSFLREEECLLESIVEMLAGHVDRVSFFRRLEQSEERYRRLFEQTPIGCCVVVNGEIAYANARLAELVGVRHGDALLGELTLSLFHHDDRERAAQLLETALTEPDSAAHGEVRCRHTDGRSIDINLSAASCTFGGHPGVQAVFVDLSNRREAEAVKKERNALREAVIAWERVLGVVGHELRTPLAAVRATSELLMHEWQIDQAQQRQFISNIHNESIRMSNMVNDLLEVARLNSGTARWNWSMFEVAKACDAAIDSIRPLVDSRHVHLHANVEESDLIMRGDADAVRRLILNLVNNAAKFTTDGEIIVEAEASEHDGHAWIEIRISDTGQGIPPETSEKLGEAFALNSGVIGDSHVRGSGLGLAICRGIAAAHGGRIRFDSEVGRGTTFFITLRADLHEPQTTGGEAAIERRVAA